MSDTAQHLDVGPADPLRNRYGVPHTGHTNE